MKMTFDKKYLCFLGTYLSFFTFILCSILELGIGIVVIKAFIILLFGLFLFGENETHRIDVEKAALSLLVLLFNALILLREKVQGQYAVPNIICSVILIIMAIIYFIRNHNGINVKEWFNENRIIILIVICFVLLSMEVVDSWLMWDAWQYYAGGSGSIQEMTRIFDVDFSGIYNLYLAEHATLGYSLWVIFFQLIEAGVASVQIADITLAGISIYAYYQILSKLLGKKYSNGVLALATIPYACSPFVLGIIGNINIDSATMYFAIIFIACSLYRLECFEMIFAALFCFTKETAVIYYVAYIVAKVVCEYSFRQSFNLWKLMKFGFGNIKNYIYALPAILWVALYKLNPNGGWGGEESALWNNKGWNCFGFSQNVILSKLKQIFFLDFNWIFWFIIAFGIILLLAKKIVIEKETLEELIPICIMGLAVIIFGCLYITYVLPRYIVPIIPAMYLVAVVILGNLKKSFFCGCNAFLSVFLLLQCFNVIDPVMKNIYASIPTGYSSHEKIYMVGNENRFDDHIVYNRQNMYWSETIVEVLERAGYNGDMLIAFPDTVFDAQYELLGNWQCLWDTETRRLVYYDESTDFTENYKWVDTCYVSNVEQTLYLRDNDYILYIVPRFSEIDFDFVSDKRIMKQGEIEHKGFSVQYMVLRAENKLPLDTGNYIVSPKLESSLGIWTDGTGLYLNQETYPINICGLITKYNFIFDEKQVAMDVQGDRADENGTVWVWEINRGHAQQWSLEAVDDYYMICWENYALTYDLDYNSIRIAPKTGEDNQLWLFSK